MSNFLIMSPPGRVERHILFSPLSPSVCPTQNRVRSTLYNLITVRDISTKLHTLVKHIQTTCRAQEPELCFGYFLLFPFVHLRCYFVSAL